MEILKNKSDKNNWNKWKLSSITSLTRYDLKKRLDEWKCVKIDGWIWQIPVWKFRAPNEIFAETDESFKEIVTKNFEKIRKLNKIQDMDEFIRQSFEYIKWKMWLNPNITLKITDDDNHYSVKENTVYMSRNRAGHKLKNIKWKWDKAEIFWWIVHELNHYLQRKEFILNFDQDSQYRAWVINYLQEYPQAKENLEYIIANYSDNIELQEEFEKAKAYWDSRQHYIPPEIDENWVVANYNEYKWQTVEEESFRRWDFVVEEYKKTVNKREK